MDFETRITGGFFKKIIIDATKTTLSNLVDKNALRSKIFEFLFNCKN